MQNFKTPIPVYCKFIKSWRWKRIEGQLGTILELHQNHRHWFRLDFHASLALWCSIHTFNADSETHASSCDLLWPVVYAGIVIFCVVVGSIRTHEKMPEHLCQSCILSWVNVYFLTWPDTWITTVHAKSFFRVIHPSLFRNPRHSANYTGADAGFQERGISDLNKAQNATAKVTKATAGVGEGWGIKKNK